MLFTILTWTQQPYQTIKIQPYNLFFSFGHKTVQWKISLDKLYQLLLLKNQSKYFAMQKVRNELFINTFYWFHALQKSYTGSGIVLVGYRFVRRNITILKAKVVVPANFLYLPLG